MLPALRFPFHTSKIEAALDVGVLVCMCTKSEEEKGEGEQLLLGPCSIHYLTWIFAAVAIIVSNLLNFASIGTSSRRVRFNDAASGRPEKRNSVAQ